MHLIATSLTLPCFLLGLISATQADTFGSGEQTFEIDFVTIGNPGNTGDNSLTRGSVEYSYRISKFEISEDMIDKANVQTFLEGDALAITKHSRGPNKPATGVSWYEAARFINWLNESTGSRPAYKFDDNNELEFWSPSEVGYNPLNRKRNSLARYVLPDDQEWYKAAYYDPNRDEYFNWPTGSDTTPTAVAGGIEAGTAVYTNFSSVRLAGPADVNFAGGLSPYGTMAQAGNVSEWTESQVGGFRGGSWSTFIGPSSSPGGSTSPVGEFNDLGFRVVSVPEPASITCLSIVCSILLVTNRYSVKNC